MCYSKNLALAAPAALAIAGALALAPAAFAQTGSANVNVRANLGAGASASASATGTAKMDNATSAPRGNSATSTGVQMRAENQSDVATQVQALLQVADRIGGIGADVRLIAREHASSSAQIEESEDAVDSRPGWLTFLFGTDYGNLGKLRSEIVTTQNHIKRLSDARDRTADVTAKAELQTQINALEVQASTTAAFVADNEDQFSIFGWLVRVFH